MKSALLNMSPSKHYTIGASEQLEKRIRTYDKMSFRKPRKSSDSFVVDFSVNEVTRNDLAAMEIKALYQTQMENLKNFGRTELNGGGGGKLGEAKRSKGDTSGRCGIYIRLWTNEMLDTMLMKIEEKKLRESKAADERLKFKNTIKPKNLLDEIVRQELVDWQLKAVTKLSEFCGGCNKK